MSKKVSFQEKKKKLNYCKSVESLPFNKQKFSHSIKREGNYELSNKKNPRDLSSSTNNFESFNFTSTLHSVLTLNNNFSNRNSSLFMFPRDINNNNNSGHSVNKNNNISQKFRNKNSISFTDRNLIKKITKVGINCISPKCDFLLSKHNNNNQIQKMHRHSSSSVNKFLEYNNNNNTLIRKRSLSKSDIKSKNNILYTNSSSLNTHRHIQRQNIFKVCPSSTLKIINDRNTINLETRLLYLLNKRNISDNFKQAIKYKAISNLWCKYSLIMENLLKSYTNSKWFLEREVTISDKVFLEYIKLLKIENFDKSFVHKVFLIFDSNNTGYINVKDFYFEMKITNQYTQYFSLIRFAAELLLSIFREENIINIYDVYYLFKKLINYYSYQKDCKRLHEYLRKNFAVGSNKDKQIEDIYINKDEFINFMNESDFMLNIFKKFKRDYQSISKLFEDELLNVCLDKMRSFKSSLTGHDINQFCSKNYESFVMLLKCFSDAKEKKENNRKMMNEEEWIDI